MRGRVEWPADGQRVGVGGGPAPRGHLQLGGLHRRVGVGRSSGRSGRLRLVLSDMSLGSVHRLPWVHPITSKFSVTTWVGGSDSVRLTVPTTDVNSLQVADINRLREGYWRW